MDGHNGWMVIKDRAVEMGEVHDIKVFPVDFPKEFCLFRKRIVWCVHKSFFYIRPGFGKK